MVEVIEWIQLAVAVVLLIFSVVVLGILIKYHKLPFNKFWKTRGVFVLATFVWILSLLLGGDQFWNADTGYFSISDNGYSILCQVHTLFTFGVSQPLFFITLLFMIRSKTNARNDLTMYNKHPNRVVMGWSFLWCLPMVAIHLLIVGLNNATSLHDSDFFWTTFDTTSHKCLVPIISTMAFTCFYAIFLVFYIFYSNKFSKSLINKTLLRRMWWSQFIFSLFFPFEVLLRFILIFTTKFQVAAEILSHIFFFIDLIICFVGLLEFALLPVLDAAEYPLLSDSDDTSLIDKRLSKKIATEDGSAIVLDTVTFKAGTDAAQNSYTNLMSDSSSSGILPPSTHSINTSNNHTAPGHNSNNNVSEQQSLEEFRQQMAKYSAHV